MAFLTPHHLQTFENAFGGFFIYRDYGKVFGRFTLKN